MHYPHLVKELKSKDMILIALFTGYLVLGFPMPESLAAFFDSMFGKIIVIIGALYLFACSNPIVGVLGLLVAYYLLKKASMSTGTFGLDEYYPTEAKKWSPYTAENQFPMTLEQEMVAKMTTSNFNTDYVKPPYKPLQDKVEGTFINR